MVNKCRLLERQTISFWLTYNVYELRSARSCRRGSTTNCISSRRLDNYRMKIFLVCLRNVVQKTPSKNTKTNCVIYCDDTCDVCLRSTTLRTALNVTMDNRASLISRRFYIDFSCSFTANDADLTRFEGRSFFVAAANSAWACRVYPKEQGAVLLTVGWSYVGNDVTHSTLVDRPCACSYKNLPTYRSYRVSNTAPSTFTLYGGQCRTNPALMAAKKVHRQVALSVIVASHPTGATSHPTSATSHPIIVTARRFVGI